MEHEIEREAAATRTLAERGEPSSIPEHGRTERHVGGAESAPRRSFPWREAFFLATAATVIGLDQWTKHLAREHLYDDGPLSISVIGNLLRLTYVENRGAAFGLFQNQTVFFIIGGLVVIAVIALSYRHLAGPSMLVNLCLGLLMGGAIGNLIDRVKHGYVVDFVELPYWPVFNVADSSLVVGVAGLAYALLLRRRPGEERLSE